MLIAYLGPDLNSNGLPYNLLKFQSLRSMTKTKPDTNTEAPSASDSGSVKRIHTATHSRTTLAETAAASTQGF